MASEQKRLFLALSLSALVLFTWQAYFAPKNNFDATIGKSENSKKSNENKVQVTKKENASGATSQEVSNVSEPTPLEVSSGFEAKEGIVTLGDNRVKISNKLEIFTFESSLSNDPFSNVVGERRPFQIFTLNQGKPQEIKLDTFNVEGSRVMGSDSKRGIGFNGEVKEDGIFYWSISSSQPNQFYFLLQSEKKEGEARQIRQFLANLKEVERANIDDEEAYEGSLKWFGVDYHYHLFATVLDNKNVSSVKIKNEDMGVKIVESTTSLSGYTLYSKKNYDNLNKIGDNLHLSIDFGVFGIIAVPILKGLQFFYKYVPNYGLAIIFVTLLIRTLLFPLQFKSFKSMKKMQKLQPELAKIKEKYGDDPQRMQKETMEIFKRNGANPMGGCLPLILQMPVFFAFYQVLFNSVELLGAPFAFWIQDLSAKDPYYVLPVLMGAAMFGQTKLNPSTSADPTQQKMMMFMPLIFTFFMKDLPAGLNLYIFVSTVFGIAQQLFVYKTVD